MLSNNGNFVKLNLNIVGKSNAAFRNRLGSRLGKLMLAALTVPFLVAGRGNPDCFDDVFTYDSCCESNNDSKCWNDFLTFDLCCVDSLVVESQENI